MLKKSFFNVHLCGLFVLLFFSFFLIFFRLGEANLGNFHQSVDEGVLEQNSEWLKIKNELFKAPMRYSYNNYHEYRYASTVQIILETGNWIELKMRDGMVNDYYQKGPIYFWLAALLSKVMGFSKFSVRFWPAFFAFAAIVMAYFLSVKIFNKKTGLFSILILATSFQFIHIEGARAVAVDTIFGFLIMAAFYALIQQKSNRKLFYIVPVLISFGSLTRSVFMIIPAVIIFFILDFNIQFMGGSGINYKDILFNFKTNIKKFLIKWVVGLVIVFAVIFPWVAVQYNFGGGKYINDIKKYQIEEEFLNKISLDKVFKEKFQFNLFWKERPLDAIFYPLVIFKGFFPWSILVVPAVLYGLQIGWREKKREILAILSLIFLILIFVYIKEQKWARYMIELYPFLAVIVAKLLSDFYDVVKSKLLQFGLLASFIVFYSVIVPYNFVPAWIGIVYSALLFFLMLLYIFYKYNNEMAFKKTAATLIISHIGVVAILNVFQPFFL